jgi:hypothetical protein
VPRGVQQERPKPVAVESHGDAGKIELSIGLDSLSIVFNLASGLLFDHPGSHESQHWRKGIQCGDGGPIISRVYRASPFPISANAGPGPPFCNT